MKPNSQGQSLNKDLNLVSHYFSDHVLYYKSLTVPTHLSVNGVNASTYRDALCQALVMTMDELEDITMAPPPAANTEISLTQQDFSTIIASLRCFFKLSAQLTARDLTPSHFQSALLSLAPNQYFFHYAESQNTCIMFQKLDLALEHPVEDAKFQVSTFKVVHPNAKVIKAQGKFETFVPESTVYVENSDLLTCEAFSTLLHQLTFHAFRVTEPTINFNGSAVVSETREEAYPDLVDKVLLASISSGRPITSPVLTLRKKLCTTVIRDAESHALMRRCPYYYAAKVCTQYVIFDAVSQALKQKSLSKDDINQVAYQLYKTFMLLLHKTILEQYFHRLPVERLKAHSGKLARRQAKLASFHSPQFYTLKVLELNKTLVSGLSDISMQLESSIVEDQRKRQKIQLCLHSQPSASAGNPQTHAYLSTLKEPEANPNEISFSNDSTANFTEVINHIKNSLSPPNSVNKNHKRATSDFEILRLFRGKNLNILEFFEISNIMDTLKSCNTEIRSIISMALTKFCMRQLLDQDESIFSRYDLNFYQILISYTKLTNSIDQNTPLAKSRYVLTCLLLYVLADIWVCRHISLFGAYRPVIQLPNLSTLYTTTRSEAEAILMIDHYFKDREQKATYRKSIFTHKPEPRSFIHNYAASSENYAHLVKKFQDYCDKKVDTLLDSFNFKHKLVRECIGRAKTLECKRIYSSKGRAIQCTEDCRRCELTNKAEKQRLEQYERTLPSEEYKRLELAFNFNPNLQILNFQNFALYLYFTALNPHKIEEPAVQQQPIATPQALLARGAKSGQKALPILREDTYVWRDMPRVEKFISNYELQTGNYIKEKSEQALYSLVSACKPLDMTHYKLIKMTPCFQNTLIENTKTMHYTFNKQPIPLDMKFIPAVYPQITEAKYSHLNTVFKKYEYDENFVQCSKGSVHKDWEERDFVDLALISAGKGLAYRNISLILMNENVNTNSYIFFITCLHAIYLTGPLSSIPGDISPIDYMAEHHVDLLNINFVTTFTNNIKAKLAEVTGFWDRPLKVVLLAVLTLNLLNRGTQKVYSTSELLNILHIVQDLLFSFSEKLKSKIDELKSVPDLNDKAREMLETYHYSYAICCHGIILCFSHPFTKKFIQTSLNNKAGPKALYYYLYASATCRDVVKNYVHYNRLSTREALPYVKDLSDQASLNVSFFIRDLLQNPKADPNFILCTRIQIVDYIKKRAPDVEKSKEIYFALDDPIAPEPDTFVSVVLEIDHKQEETHVSTYHSNKRVVGFQISLLNGAFYKNGEPIGHLPKEIIQAPAYKRIFGERILEAWKVDDLEKYKTVKDNDGVSFLFYYPKPTFHGAQTSENLIIIKTQEVKHPGTQNRISNYLYIPHKLIDKHYNKEYVDKYFHYCLLPDSLSALDNFKSGDVKIYFERIQKAKKLSELFAKTTPTRASNNGFLATNSAGHSATLISKMESFFISLKAKVLLDKKGRVLFPKNSYTLHILHGQVFHRLAEITDILVWYSPKAKELNIRLPLCNGLEFDITERLNKSQSLIKPTDNEYHVDCVISSTKLHGMRIAHEQFFGDLIGLENYVLLEPYLHTKDTESKVLLIRNGILTFKSREIDYISGHGSSSVNYANVEIENTNKISATNYLKYGKVLHDYTNKSDLLQPRFNQDSNGYDAEDYVAPDMASSTIKDRIHKIQRGVVDVPVVLICPPDETQADDAFKYSKENGFFQYTVRTDLGQVVPSSSIAANAYLATMYAMTNQMFPNRLSREKGCETAIRLLNGPSVYSMEPLPFDAIKVLKQFSLAFIRFQYYPNELNQMITPSCSLKGGLSVIENSSNAYPILYELLRQRNDRAIEMREELKMSKHTVVPIKPSGPIKPSLQKSTQAGTLNPLTAIIIDNLDENDIDPELEATQKTFILPPLKTDMQLNVEFFFKEDLKLTQMVLTHDVISVLDKSLAKSTSLSKMFPGDPMHLHEFTYEYREPTRLELLQEKKDLEETSKYARLKISSDVLCLISEFSYSFTTGIYVHPTSWTKKDLMDYLSQLPAIPSLDTLDWTPQAIEETLHLSLEGFLLQSLRLAKEFYRQNTQGFDAENQDLVAHVRDLEHTAIEEKVTRYDLYFFCCYWLCLYQQEFAKGGDSRRRSCEIVSWIFYIINNPELFVEIFEIELENSYALLPEADAPDYYEMAGILMQFSTPPRPITCNDSRLFSRNFDAYQAAKYFELEDALQFSKLLAKHSWPSPCPLRVNDPAAREIWDLLPNAVDKQHVHLDLEEYWKPYYSKHVLLQTFENVYDIMTCRANKADQIEACPILFGIPSHINANFSLHDPYRFIDLLSALNGDSIKQSLRNHQNTLQPFIQNGGIIPDQPNNPILPDTGDTEIESLGGIEVKCASSTYAQFTNHVDNYFDYEQLLKNAKYNGAALRVYVTYNKIMQRVNSLQSDNYFSNLSLKDSHPVIDYLPYIFLTDASYEDSPLSPDDGLQLITFQRFLQGTKKSSKELKLLNVVQLPSANTANPTIQTQTTTTNFVDEHDFLEKTQVLEDFIADLKSSLDSLNKVKTTEDQKKSYFNRFESYLNCKERYGEISNNVSRLIRYLKVMLHQIFEVQKFLITAAYESSDKLSCLFWVKHALAPSLNDVLSLFRHSEDLAELKNFTPLPKNFTASSISPDQLCLSSLLKKVSVLYALTAARLSKMIRLHKIVSNNVVDRANFIAELCEPGYTNWNILDYPGWLLFELERDVTIRAVQAKIAFEMITPVENTNTSLQAQCGIGKSYVITPLIIIELTSNKYRSKNLMQVTVLRSLINMNMDFLRGALGNLLYKKVVRLFCERKIHYSLNYTSNLHQLLKSLQYYGDFIITTPESLMSLQLKLFCNLIPSDAKHVKIKLGKYTSSKDDTTLDDEQIRIAHCFFNLYDYLMKSSRILMDEVDEILKIKYELIYTVGTRRPIDGGDQRWKLVYIILELLLQKAYAFLAESASHKEKIDLQYLQEDSDSTYVFPCIRFVDFKVFKRIEKEIVDHMFDPTRKSDELKDFPNFEFENYPVFKAYVYNAVLSQSDIATLSGNMEFLKHKNLLQILRGIFAFGTLERSFEKRYRVNYGLNPKNHSKLAVPFYALDMASDSTEFGNVTMAIILSCLSYYYCGLTPQMFDNAISHTYKEKTFNIDYLDIVEPLKKSHDLVVKKALDEDKLGSWETVNVDNMQHKEILYRLHSKNPRFIQYYLNNLVFPRTQTFEKKISSSSFDMIGYNQKRITAFSGTRDSSLLFPLSIQQHDLDELKGTNAYAIREILTSLNDFFNVFDHNTSTTYKKLEKIVRACCTSEMGPNFLKTAGYRNRVVIDAGGLFLDLTNKQVIESWFELIKKKLENTTGKDAKLCRCYDDIKAGVFFNKDNQPYVLEMDGSSREMLLKNSPYNHDLSNCIVFINDEMSRGTDLKLNNFTKAAVTVGKGMTNSKLIQSVMRMRKLGNGHCVHFWASSEVDREIENYANLMQEKALRAGARTENQAILQPLQATGAAGASERKTSKSLVTYCIQNTVSSLENELSLWAIKGFNYSRKFSLYQVIRHNFSIGRPEHNLGPTEEYLEEDALSLDDSYGQERHRSLVVKTLTDMAANIEKTAIPKSIFDHLNHLTPLVYPEHMQDSNRKLAAKDKIFRSILGYQTKHVNLNAHRSILYKISHFLKNAEKIDAAIDHDSEQEKELEVEVELEQNTKHSKLLQPYICCEVRCIAELYLHGKWSHQTILSPQAAPSAHFGTAAPVLSTRSKYAAMQSTNTRDQGGSVVRVGDGYLGSTSFAKQLPSSFIQFMNSRQLYATTNFINTVAKLDGTMFDDNYLKSPRWILVSHDHSIVVLLDGYDVMTSIFPHYVREMKHFFKIGATHTAMEKMTDYWTKLGSHSATANTYLLMFNPLVLKDTIPTIFSSSYCISPRLMEHRVAYYPNDFNLRFLITPLRKSLPLIWLLGCSFNFHNRNDVYTFAKAIGYIPKPWPNDAQTQELICKGQIATSGLVPAIYRKNHAFFDDPDSLVDGIDDFIDRFTTLRSQNRYFRASHTYSLITGSSLSCLIDSDV